MPGYIVREVMREYEKDRDKAERTLKRQQEELYVLVPRIREIDEELKNIGASTVKKLLEKQLDSNAVEELSKNCQSLREEKEILIKSAGRWDAFNKSPYTCTKCNDTGFINNERCLCFKRKLINKFYEISNLNKILQEENFDHFNINLYSNETDSEIGMSPRANMNTIWSHALAFAKNFDSEFKNFIFHGSTGLGKTFLCNCIAKELLDMGKSVIYITSPQLFKLIEEVRFNKTEEETGKEEFVELVMDCELLIIDDLGTEVTTIVTASEFFNIINTRLLSRKHTIISSNIPLTELENIYSDRITSRIFGNYTVLRFVGEDLRIKLKYKV